MQIGRRIYYEKKTGNVFVDTGERSGSVRETTIEEDFTTYVPLAERVPETVGHIQLEYGQYAQDFAECNGVRVNPETLALEFSYPNPNEPKELPIFRKPLSVELEEAKKAALDAQEAVLEVYEMLLGMQTT
ncbi:hypothetical protein P9578_03760 [Brevibacillus choshinensis]|uniref:hypothetical protein n=1 Tax=Brevibacillus choshinensis TaxID=54911 RepID=UPI002E20F532|nr:hypothetical protein [Brevibacillus choshinensis]